jgi:integrase
MSGYPKKDEKSGTYYFVLENGKGPNGKRKRIVRKGFKKRSDAKKAMEDMLIELKTTEGQTKSEKTSDINVRDYLDYWLESYAKTNTKPKTYIEYGKVIKTHINPYLGNIELQRLKGIDIQEYYTSKLNALSAQSVLHHHRLLSKALNDAIDWEYIDHNPAKRAKPPKPVKKEMHTYSDEQINLLLKVSREISPIYFPIIYAAAHTGLRKSELIGLRWDYVDLTAQKLYISLTITEANGKRIFNSWPKNKKPRSIKLTTGLARLLESLKLEHDKRKASLGETFNPLNLVFCNSAGNIMSQSEISRALKKSIKAAGLPDIRFHDLRHSHATILLEENVHPKIVSERLGHSRFNVTMDIYSHVTQSMEELAVGTLDKILK